MIALAFPSQLSRIQYQLYKVNNTVDYIDIMVFLPRFAAALAVLTSVFAAPTGETEASVEKRGPYNYVMGTDHPLTLARRNETLARRATNYNQDYTTGGSVYFAPESGEFYVSWDTTDDFVVGVGWNPGSTE